MTDTDPMNLICGGVDAILHLKPGTMLATMEKAESERQNADRALMFARAFIRADARHASLAHPVPRFLRAVAAALIEDKEFAVRVGQLMGPDDAG